MPERLELPTGELHAAPARLLRGARWAGERAYRKARRGEAVELAPSARSPCTAPSCSGTTGERARFEIECSAGHLRPHARRGPGRRLLRGARAHGDRALPAGGRRPERVVPLAEALAFLPERALDARRGRGASATAARLDAGEPAAGPRAAHPRRASWWRSPSRRDGELQPVVVFAPDEGHPPPRRRARRRAPRAVAIGTFDGVHLGHREVIRGNDTVLTFDPHPLAVIHPEAHAEAARPRSRSSAT